MLNLSDVAISPALLLGLDEGALTQAPELGCLLHPLVIEPLQALAAAAGEQGFRLRVASSYRNFARQLLIWNNKACGLRPVLDAAGQPLDMTHYSDREKVFAILRWSALPGASRHHWGTDLDVYDDSRIASDYALQLTVEETEGEGPFAEFHRWLSAELGSNPRGFVRPYQLGRGAIAPEPWHLSYSPIASLYAAQLTEDIVRTQLQATEICLKEALLENLSEIYQGYIQPYINC